MTQADCDEGTRPGPSSDEQAENRELRKRVRLLEQENEVLRRAAAYLSQASLPGK
jgi:transposase